MKNSNDTIRNRTRDLPTFSAVPQPTALPRASTTTSTTTNTTTVIIIIIIIIYHTSTLIADKAFLHSTSNIALEVNTETLKTR